MWITVTKSNKMSPIFIKEFLTFVAFFIPILVLIWKIFAVREKVYDQLQTLEHRHQILETRLIHLEDKLNLTTNGLRELIEHKSTRFISMGDRSLGRIEDMEEFLAKTTQFNRRGGHQ